MIRKAWAYLLHWFEHGDLVPLLIVVSAAHYTSVLAGHDAWPVAVAIGALVDLGHYRWVRAAARYRSGRWTQVVTRWTFAIAMTGVSLAYHWRYYGGDWWLSVPMPLLIASLAWLAQVDSGTGAQPAKPERAEPAPAAQEAHAAAHVCGVCGKGYAKQPQLAAHMKAHAQAKRNGHEKERTR